MRAYYSGTHVLSHAFSCKIDFLFAISIAHALSVWRVRGLRTCVRLVSLNSRHPAATATFNHISSVSRFATKMSCCEQLILQLQNIITFYARTNTHTHTRRRAINSTMLLKFAKTRYKHTRTHVAFVPLHECTLHSRSGNSDENDSVESKRNKFDKI